VSLLFQWLRRAEPGSSVTSRRRGVRGGRYVALVKGVGRVDVTMTSSGPVYKSTLVIDDVRPGDAGLYVCSLSTSAGHISSTQAYLTVFTGTNNTGRSPGQAEGLAGCGHSKIARVYAYWVGRCRCWLVCTFCGWRKYCLQVTEVSHRNSDSCA